MSELKRYHDDKDIGLVECKDGSWMRSERCIEEIAKLKELLPVWVSVDERLPANKCIATYLNSHDKRRTIIAIYCPRFTIESSGEADDYDEYLATTDTCYFKEGWYECQENWGEYAMIYVNEGEVTHWMKLPPAPSEAAK